MAKRDRSGSDKVESSPSEAATFVNKVRELLMDQHQDLYKAFLHQWNLYSQGRISKHDLYCEVAVPFSQVRQDFVAELKKFVKA